MGGELLFESDRTRVTRTTSVDGTTVIRKQPRGAGAVRRVRHERMILERLAGAPGVPRLAPGAERDAVVLHDCGGQPLAACLSQGPLALETLLELAVQLTRIVAAVHRLGVVHRDINPSNVLVHGDPLRATLIDFDVASTLAQERPATAHDREMAGTLQYLAPEQTGRTGWEVDTRADLYALGVTLYQAATGVLPFDDSDPLTLIHAHLTQVPTLASGVNPDVPAELSAVLAHLLEKEPGRRYQSAEGLLHDLRRIRGAPDHPIRAAFRPGERDFPWRLNPPSRLVGRSRELAVLSDQLAASVTGRCRTMFVSGAPGVGKSALIDELRSLVTVRGGWLLRGKSDQYRQDPGSSSVRQALGNLGHRLLAEPEPRLAPVRAAILAALGPRAGLVAAVLPEFRALLGLDPDVEGRESSDARTMLRRAELDLLRAVALPDRPLVIVLEDLQWAGQAALDLVDDLVSGEGPDGVLLVGTYRDTEVDAALPLSAVLSRWRRTPIPPVEVRLANLPSDDVSAMIGEMLRQPPSEVCVLADAVRRHTDGNPFDTVEFLNMLRHEGVLVLADDGWTWDVDGLDSPIGRGGVLSLLTARIVGLPAPTREVLEVMACLGAEVDLDVLAAVLCLVSDESGGSVHRASDLAAVLAPALDKGLLVMADEGRATVQFRHDRIQQAAYTGMSPAARNARRLALARRLSPIPGYAVLAAEQYLQVAGRLTDPGERRTVALLFQNAARHARLLGNPAQTERLLAAAAGLLDLGEPPSCEDQRLQLSIAVDRHAALFALARFDEMDRLYATLSREHPDPVQRADASCVQVRSLTNRERAADALALGLAVLGDLGHPAPGPPDLEARTHCGVEALKTWVSSGSEVDDVRRGTNRDPRLAAVAGVINRTIPPAFFTGAPVTTWLITEAASVWAHGGPSPSLVGPLVRAPFATIQTREDYRAGYQAARRVLAAAEALGYEVAYDRYLYALGAGPWFDPLEATIEQARRAREDLLHAGRVNDASYTYFVTVCSFAECSATVGELLDEVESALALTARTGNHHVAAVMRSYRQAVRALRGETRTPGGFDDDSFDEHAYLDAVSDNLTAAGHFHTLRALTAAIAEDQASLLQHAEAGMSLLRAFRPTQAATRAHLMRALAVAGAADRTAGVDDALLAEFDRHRDWMGRRAAEAPANFLHLSSWLEAERAWLAQDFARADQTFDLAQREAATRQRPWQRALIAERRARFHLAHGMEHAGRTALREAREEYRRWGATGKVDQLDAAHPYLRTTSGPGGAGARPVPGTTISSDGIDVVAVLRASQALSSQTNLTSLHDRVVEIVGALTGATDVRLLLWETDAGRWVLSGHQPTPARGDPTSADGDASHRQEESAGLSPEEAASAGLLPISAFRYVERTRESLLVDDATRDDRFAGDPFLQHLDTCSLLVMPILSRGAPTAMLMLLNQRGSGAFTTDREGIVQLLAGQLSVSLENTRLYAALERKVAERTQALTAANRQLEQLAVTDPLTGLPNRRRLTDTLAAEWHRSMDPPVPMAVAMIDIDQFKQYNDHYGHPAGDRALTLVATAIRRAIRATDVVARYGGEEFMVIFPNTAQEAAAPITERIRAGVAELNEAHEYATHGRVTVSIGLATVIPLPGSTPEHLVQLADTQLYRAKNEGRNRVSCAAPE